MPVFAALVPLAGYIGTTVVLGAAGTAAGMAMSNNAKAETKAANAANDAAGVTRASLTGGKSTTVDATSTNSQANMLGRAALISTSPQGVQGTDATNRYKLLGNSGGLGNN